MTTDYLLYDSIRMFYLNGGGKSYIISIGDYKTPLSRAKFETAISGPLKKEDEPTLILFPDAVKLADTDLYFLQNMALKQCYDLQDRFTICDLTPSKTDTEWANSVTGFRNNIDLISMNYGAAYTPYLRSNLSKNVTYRALASALFKFGTNISLSSLVPTADIKTKDLIASLEKSIADNDFIKSKISDTILDDYNAKVQVFKQKVGIAVPVPADVKAAFKDLYVYLYSKADTILDDLATNSGNVLNATIPPVPPSTDPTIFVLDTVRKVLADSLRSRMKTLNSYNKAHKALTDVDDKLYNPKANWTATGWVDAGINVMDDANVVFDDTIYPNKPIPAADPDKEKKFQENMIAAEPKISQIMKDLFDSLSFIKTAAAFIENGFERLLYDTFSLYRSINQKIASTATELPPSGAIAGIYAFIDATRGVWKAPANVNIQGVESLSYTIDNTDNDDLNISDTGKSINAIRFFTGKGTLVWGARTIDGNSNEWRYVPVRRLFITIEESAKKATIPFVFEPNDANTWVKVRAMLENYLTLQWRAGALAGPKPEYAFFVKCGLGQTMTSQDILEGRLIVEIGLAAVRPAEFIILRFSHLMQKA
ncbi:phage tail protein [Solitalea longa]|uniref:Phage tail protein n=2 Tax=Solitalea longa TaxID=2079460 RepID=A0A2S5A5K8_9SPHI|nr:phage tail protein [Solitalea longa]